MARKPKTKPETPPTTDRTYIGPVARITTRLLDGREIVVTHGETVTGLTAEDAARLDAQPANWTTPAPADPADTMEPDA